MTGASQSICISAAFSLGISFIAVSLRCFVRLRIVKAFGTDDILMVIAMIFNAAFSIGGGIIASYNGLGQSMLDLDPSEIESGLLCWLLGALFYTLTCCFAKTSIAMSLLRLALSKTHRMALWGVIIWAIIDGTTSWFFLLLQCHPVSFFWDRNQPGSCLNSDFLIAITYIYSVGAFITDTIIAVIPVAMIRGLSMNPRLKRLLMVLLGMGWIACIAVAVRIPFVHTYQDPDFLYATTQITVCSTIETGLGIAAAGLMTIRPLFRYFNSMESWTIRRRPNARTNSTERLQGESYKGMGIQLHEQQIV